MESLSESIKHRALCYVFVAFVFAVVGTVLFLSENAPAAASLDPGRDFLKLVGACKITNRSHSTDSGTKTTTNVLQDGKTRLYTHKYCDDVYAYKFEWDALDEDELASSPEALLRGNSACEDLYDTPVLCEPDYSTRDPHDCDPHSKSKEEICKVRKFPMALDGKMCRNMNIAAGLSNAATCKHACCDDPGCVIWQFGGAPAHCWLGQKGWCNSNVSSSWMEDCCETSSLFLEGGAQGIPFPNVEASFSVGDLVTCWVPANESSFSEDKHSLYQCANRPCVKIFDPSEIEQGSPERQSTGKLLLAASACVLFFSICHFRDWREKVHAEQQV